MTRRKNVIEGRVWIRTRDPNGQAVVLRRATNTVMLSGAELIASLITGSSTQPINGMAVGLDTTPSSPPYDSTGLTTTDHEGAVAVLRAAVAISPDAMNVELVPDLQKVRVSVQGVLPPDHAVSPDPEVTRIMVGEAALGVLAGDGESLEIMYNRVVFEPIPKRPDHELALYWEIDFPYGM